MGHDSDNDAAASLTSGNQKTQIVDGDGNVVRVTDHKAFQVTPPPEGKTAFGEQVVAETLSGTTGEAVAGVKLLERI